jgi:hypothetical protein
MNNFKKKINLSIGQLPENGSSFILDRKFPLESIV